MLFLSLRHMAGGLNVQKGPFEGISRKLERRTSPDTLALVQNSWLLLIFSFPLSSATFLLYFLSLPLYFFSILFLHSLSLSLSLNHPSPSPDVALFRHICFAQTDSWPAQSWCHAYLKEKTTTSSLDNSQTSLSWGGGGVLLKTNRPVEMVDEHIWLAVMNI